jgi:SAM-dependent methyltransferase
MVNGASSSIYFISISALVLLPIFILLLFFCIQNNSKQTRIKQWKKSLNLTNHTQIFQQLYSSVDGFAASRLARQKQDAIEFTYGEIEFIPFIALLSLVSLNRDTVFYDLGCGVGKAVIACAMVYPVRKCVGIELLPELYFIAQQQTQQLATYPDYQQQAKKILILQDDILEAELSEATLIFINSTTFFGTIWEKINLRLSNLSQLQTVITTSKALPNADFSLINTTELQMSWGVVLAFIHTRKTNFH